MKENTCNYSDEWQPYIGDYDKFEYDIKLADGRIIENCYPNAGLFNVLDNEDSYPEAGVVEIRFSANPKSLLNHKYSTNPLNTYLRIPGADEFMLTHRSDYHPVQKHIGKLVDVRTTPKIGRNEPCPCDSGKKYKKCCLNTVN